MQGLDAFIGTLAVTIMFAVSGLPISYYFLRDEEAMIRLIASFFLGFSVFISAEYWGGLIGIDFVSILTLFVIYSGAAILLILKARSKVFWDMKKSAKALSVLAFLFLSSFFFLLSPLILSGDFKSILGYNGDLPTGASVADFFVRSSLYGKTPNTYAHYVPVASIIYIFHAREAFLILLAAVSASTGFRSYMVYSMLSALVTSLSVFTIYILGKEFGLRSSVSFLLGLVLAFLPAQVWFYLDCFPIQLLGFSAMPISYVIVHRSIRSGNSRALVASGLLTSLVLVSHPMIGSIYAIAILVFVSCYVVKRGFSLNSIRYVAILAVSVLILGAPMVWEFMTYAMFHLSVTAGNIPTFPPVGSLVGIQQVRPDLSQVFYMPKWAYDVIASFGVFGALLGLVETLKKRNWIALPLLVSTAAYMLATVLRSYGYSFAKAVPLASLILFYLIFMLLQSRMDALQSIMKNPKWRFARVTEKIRHILPLFMLALLLGSIFTVGGATSISTMGGYVVGGVMDKELEKSYIWMRNAIPKDSKVYFLSSYYYSFWARYFIDNSELFAPFDVYVGRSQSPEEMISQSDVYIIGSDMLPSVSNDLLNYIKSRGRFQYIYAVSPALDDQGHFLAQPGKGISLPFFLIYSSKELNNLAEAHLYGAVKPGAVLGFGFHGLETSGSVLFRWTAQNATLWLASRGRLSRLLIEMVVVSR